MSSNVKDILNAILQSETFVGARNYLSSNVDIVSKKLSSATEPYQSIAKKNADVAKTFLSKKVREVRSADSLSSAIEIIVGAVMALLRLLMEVAQRVRQFVISEYRRRYSEARVSVRGFVEDVKTKAVELPSTPVGKKVEEVSRKVLGEVRHDQAVDFIKANVIPHVYKAPAEVNADSPTQSSAGELLIKKQQTQRRK